MNERKKRILYTKFVILILCFFIILRIFSLTLSKYESEASSRADVNIAFYLLNVDYKSMTLNLDSLFPNDGYYTYSFSIGNQDNENVAEVDLKYELTIRTTTNLPLEYQLYMNEEYDDTGAESIIESIETEPDADGTYFTTINTEEIQLNYNNGVTNIYQLVIKFPENYNTEDYQDIIEMIEINVDGKQVTT